MPNEPRDDEDRGHEHPHAHGDASDLRRSALTRRVTQVIAMLERRGITSGAEVDATLERFLAAARPANGARLVARAWLDGAFKRRLLTDANAAVAELGIDLTHWAPVRLRAVENTEGVHNVIVCTLCSCYPIALLGPSPSWYKSEAYRARVVRSPRAVLAEFGYALPDEVEVRVWDSTAELRYVVIPRRPAGTDGWGLDELAGLVGRDALIGVAPAAPPAPAGV